MVYILYNPLANNNQGTELKSRVIKFFQVDHVREKNLLEIKDIPAFCNTLESYDTLVLVGGNGTLNYFINQIYGQQLNFRFLYYPAGSGNDFARDVTFKTDLKFENDLIPMDRYIQHLPEIYVAGETRRFISGVGFGIDGYCCEKGDEKRAKSDKPVNYTGIAIGGVLGGFKPCNAKITVDKTVKEYESVWLAPTMLGRFYGGGMEVAPLQDRFNEKHTLSIVVWHTKSAIATLANFPKIFEGTHVEKKDMVDIMEGHLITVEFSKPQALQVDGETFKNVSKYTVYYE